MARAQPEGMVTNVPADILTAAKFAVENENENKGTKYVFEYVACYWPKTSGHRYYLIIQVASGSTTKEFGVLVYQNASTNQLKVEQFSGIFDVTF